MLVLGGCLIPLVSCDHPLAGSAAGVVAIRGRYGVVAGWVVDGCVVDGCVVDGSVVDG